jgi:thiol-disulfide isomerase/thioredoxin
MKENEFVLLQFFTEGCPHCQEFAPIYLEAAKEMKFTKELSHVKIAKIDGQKNEEVTNSYKVQGFPDIKLISVQHGIQADFFGERKVEALLNFVRTRITKRMYSLNSTEELTKLENTKKLTLIICGKNETYPDLFDQLLKLMMNHEELEVFHTAVPSVTDNLECSNDKPGIVMIKNYDEKRLRFEVTPFNSSKFEDWFGVFSLPTLVNLTDENVQTSLQQNIPSIIMITKDENSPETLKLKKMFHTRAKLFRVS